MNNRLQTIFTREEELVESDIDDRFIQMEDILVNQQVTKLMEELDVRKVMGLGGFWDNVHNIIK